MDIEDFRRIHLAIAEWIDTWRIVPRVMVIAYMWLIYETAMWYMGLDAHLIPGCMPVSADDCIVLAPTTQHAALITTLIGFSAGIFGFYASTGKKTDVPSKKPKLTLDELIAVDKQTESVKKLSVTKVETPLTASPEVNVEVKQDAIEIPPDDFDDRY